MPGLPCTAAVPRRRRPVALLAPAPAVPAAPALQQRVGWPWQSRSAGATLSPGTAPACAIPPAPPRGSHQGWDFGAKDGERPPLLGQPAAPCCPPSPAEHPLLLTSTSPVSTGPRGASDPASPRGLCGTARVPALAEGWQPTWCRAYLRVGDVIYDGVYCCSFSAVHQQMVAAPLLSRRARSCWQQEMTSALKRFLLDEKSSCPFLCTSLAVFPEPAREQSKYLPVQHIPSAGL